MSVLVPPSLKKGDTIGLVCPAGYMDKSNTNECVRVLQELWGFKVKVGKTVGGASHTYFSGTDAERLTDLQQMLDDNEVQAVLCARGGYGMGRIIDAIDFKKFKKKPKWVIGFSDITIFHSHVNRNFNIAALHAPMAAAFNDKGYNNKYVKSLRDALMGKQANYSCKGYPLNKTGQASGVLVGGNLALIVHAIGTRSDVKTKERILFLEDIGEQKYNIDRMFYQLKRSGKLDTLKGLIIGRFSDVQDTQRPFGEDVYGIINALVKEYDYPVCYNFPVSHDAENFALKIGVPYTLNVTKRLVTLTE